MTEASRFLRYATPGLLAATTAVLTASLVNPKFRLDDLMAADIEAVATVVALFLASGAVGFFFATLHHRLHWWRRDSAIDHRACLQELQAKGVLRILRLDGSEMTGNLTTEQAWVLVTGIWHERLETSNMIRGANDRTVGLNDLAHSLGTARVAVALGAIAGAAWTLSSETPQWDGLGILIAIALVILAI